MLDSFIFICFVLFIFGALYNFVLVYDFFISPGIMLLIYTKTSSHVPLKILSIEDGTVLKSFNHLIHRNSKVDFIEQFNEKLLVKQENENLQILDVSNFLIFTWFIYIVLHPYILLLITFRYGLLSLRKLAKRNL